MPVENADEATLIFDEAAVHQLRRIAFLLANYHLNEEGLKMVSSLLNELADLRREVRFLREK